MSAGNVCPICNNALREDRYCGSCGAFVGLAADGGITTIRETGETVPVIAPPLRRD